MKAFDDCKICKGTGKIVDFRLPKPCPECQRRWWADTVKKAKQDAEADEWYQRHINGRDREDGYNEEDPQEEPPF